MIVNEPLFLAESHDPQARRHRAFARRENRADQQDLGVFHTGLEKSGANSTIRGDNTAGRVSMEKTPFGEEVFPQLTLSAGVFSKIKMAKVELRGRFKIRKDLKSMA